jgi:hypothetical protein
MKLKYFFLLFWTIKPAQAGHCPVTPDKECMGAGTGILVFLKWN